MANISFNTVALFNAAKSTLVGDSGADTLGLGYDTLGSPPTAVVFNDSTLGDPAAEPAHFFLTHFTSLNFDRPLHGPSLLSNRIVVQLFLQLSEMRPRITRCRTAR